MLRLSAGARIGDDDDVTSPPPDDAAPSVRPRRLHRSTTDRYLGGVAGGIADRFSTDPALIRLGLVAVTLYFGFRGGGGHLLVLVPYAVLWLLLPTDAGPSIVNRLGRRDGWREVALIAVAVAAAVLLGSLESFVILALGGLGVVLLRDRTAPSPPDPPEHAPTLQGLIPGRSGVRPAVPRREPALWPLTVGLLVVIGVLAIAADQAIADGVDPRVVIDLGLLAVGGVLVLSAWRGRARITVLALVVLVPLWVATSVPDIGRFAGEGRLEARPTTLPDADFDAGVPVLDYERGYGTIDVDLTELDLAEGSEIEVRVAVTAGRAVVTVPADARIAVDGTIGVGAISVDAPRHWHSDRDPAFNRNVDRSYPALGTECWDFSYSNDDLIEMARRAGLIEDSVDDPPVPVVIAAIEDAGYPRPAFEYEQEIWEEPPPVDEYGDPITTTMPPADTSSTMTYWLVSVDRMNTYQLCRPEPPPSQPATIVITPTIGLGTLEVHRV